MRAESVIAAADEILAGRWELLGAVRQDMEDPDWFFDPVTGTRAPQADYCFKVNHRSEDVTGNVKQIWELSRMHHLTVLAAAFALTGDERYADARRRPSPFLVGAEPVSLRRALDERDRGRAATDQLGLGAPTARRVGGGTGPLRAQRGGAVPRSGGTSTTSRPSAVAGRPPTITSIAEAAGLLVAALAFDWFAESHRWAEEAARVLEQELRSNTFPSGVNREMAFDYHGFVAELAVVAAVEADWAGRPLSEDLWGLLDRMFDVVAATVDVKLAAPRHGDGDNGRALVLDPPTAERWSGLLAIGEALFDAPAWWPTVEPTVTSTLLAIHGGGRRPSTAPEPSSEPLRRCRPDPDCGAAPSDGEEIWCRCDAGPHGFLSIAAHAHADALAVEVRHDGTDVLADPGYVLLPRRAPMAQLLPLDPGPQHHRGGRHRTSRPRAVPSSGRVTRGAR